MRKNDKRTTKKPTKRYIISGSGVDIPNVFTLDYDKGTATKTNTKTYENVHYC